ncbi:MAG: hypothetical protein ACK496_10425 [Acidobacteriota bacterium]
MMIWIIWWRLTARILGSSIYEAGLRWAEAIEGGGLTPLVFFCRYFASLEDPWHSLGRILDLC